MVVKKGFSSSEEIIFSLLSMLILNCILYYFCMSLMLVQCKETFPSRCLHANTSINQQKTEVKSSLMFAQKTQDISMCLALVALGRLTMTNTLKCGYSLGRKNFLITQKGKKSNIDLVSSSWQAELLGSVRITVTLLRALLGRQTHCLKCGQARTSLYIYIWFIYLLLCVTESLIPSW